MMTVLMQILANLDQSSFCFFLIPGSLMMFLVNDILQACCCPRGEIESTSLKLLQDCCRVMDIRLVFQRGLYDFCLGITGSYDKCCSLRIVGNSRKANGYDKTIPGYFYTTQVRSCCCLGFKICCRKPGS